MKKKVLVLMLTSGLAANTFASDSNEELPSLQKKQNQQRA